MMKIIQNILMYSGGGAVQEQAMAPNSDNCGYYIAGIAAMGVAVTALFAWCKSLSNQASRAEEKRAKFAEDMVKMLERQSGQGGTT
jgi:hypothetical protein